MEKIDYKKKYKYLYSPKPGIVEEVTVPKMNFAMIDGEGSPEAQDNHPQFQDAISALYGVTYTLKMGRKKEGIEPDYTIAPLDGLWWMVDGAEFDTAKPNQWRWTMMIMQPDFISKLEFDDAVKQLKKKKDNPQIDNLRLETYEEGLSVQIMHVGPYSEEGPNIAKMQSYVKEKNYKPAGKHHEIYLGDPRRTKPEKLKTILRQPVMK